MTKLSVIIPCYNSEKMIRTVVETSIEYIKKLGAYDYEFVLVNDCSDDRTFEEIRSLCKDYSFILGIDLAKNSGQHNALLAGLHYTSGDIIVSMDDDMQTHPSQLSKLIDRLNEGYDVVYGVYPQKKTSAYRKLGSNFNNFTVAKLIGKPLDLKVSSFWVIRRFVRDEAIRYPSNFTNLQGCFLKITKKLTNVEIEHFSRMAGSSGYTLKKLLRLWSSNLNYSMLPLRISFFLSLFFLLCGVATTAVLAIWKQHIETFLLLILIEIITALQFGVIGIVSEYIGRMFMVVMQEPQTTIREVINERTKT